MNNIKCQNLVILYTLSYFNVDTPKKRRLFETRRLLEEMRYLSTIFLCSLRYLKEHLKYAKGTQD